MSGDVYQPPSLIHWICFGSGGYPLSTGDRQTHGTTLEHNARCGVYRRLGETLEGDRDGVTFDPEIDRKPLTAQMLRVYDVFELSFSDAWLTLSEIADAAEGSEASISARLRDFRKPRFGGHTVERRRRGAGRVYEYRLVWNEQIPRPTRLELEAAWAKLSV